MSYHSTQEDRRRARRRIYDRAASASRERHRALIEAARMRDDSDDAAQMTSRRPRARGAE